VTSEKANVRSLQIWHLIQENIINPFYIEILFGKEGRSNHSSARGRASDTSWWKIQKNKKESRPKEKRSVRRVYQQRVPQMTFASFPSLLRLWECVRALRDPEQGSNSE
jgi:hypothetical protein